MKAFVKIENLRDFCHDALMGLGLLMGVLTMLAIAAIPTVCALAFGFKVGISPEAIVCVFVAVPVLSMTGLGVIALRDKFTRYTNDDICDPDNLAPFYAAKEIGSDDEDEDDDDGDGDDEP